MSDIELNKDKDKAKTFKKKPVRAVTLILVALIIVLVALIINIITSQAKGKVPFVGKYAWLRIETPSMEDTLPVGSFILIKKTSPDKIKKDDIITFYSDDPSIEGYPNTHRVVTVEETSDGRFVFTTKGDNNPLEDKFKVQGDKVIGIYVRRLKVMTALSNLFRTKVAFLLLIIPAIILVAFSAKDLFSTAKNIKNEKTKEEMIKLEVERLKKEAEEQKKTNDENNHTTET